MFRNLRRKVTSLVILSKKERHWERTSKLVTLWNNNQRFIFKSFLKDVAFNTKGRSVSHITFINKCQYIAIFHS
jgi:hypothetical protein